MLSNALVLPHFDYCSSVWSNSSKTNLSSLQIQHNKLARIILSADYLTPIDDMLNELCWHRLNKRWDIAMYCCIYKCLMNLAPSYLTSNFTFASSIHSYSTRYQESASLDIPKYNSCSGQRTFHYRAVSLWNNLPSDFRMNIQNGDVSYGVFRDTIKQFV